MGKCGIEKHTELLNDALTLLKWAIRTREEGRAIGSVNREGNDFREIIMPCLETTAEKSNRDTTA